MALSLLEYPLLFEPLYMLIKYLENKYRDFKYNKI